MNLKKIFALVLALVMVLSFASCDRGVDVDDTDKIVTQDANLSKPGVEPIWIGEGTPTVSILMKKSDTITSYDENSYTKKLEKDGNVEIAFEFLPAAEIEVSIRTRMMGGEEMPMVLNYGLSVAAAKEYSEAGGLVNLKPYIDSKIAYYTVQNNEANPELYVLDQITTAEGDIYGLPRYNAALSNETKYKLWINIDWLEKFGMTREDVKTTEDFYNVMVKFRDEDPNGNGQKDEIPFFPTTDFGGTAYKFLTNAFIYEGDNDLLLVDQATNTIKTSYQYDEWYKAGEFIKKLVDDKLLPTDAFTTNTTALRAVQATALAKNGGKPILGASTRSSSSMFYANTADESTDFRLSYACLAPLEGPDGQKYAGYSWSTSQNYWHVTKWAGEYEQLCVRLGDVQQREDYYIQGRFGNEGENWMTAEQYLKEIPNWDDLLADAQEDGINLTKDMIKAVDPYATMGIKGEYFWFNDTWGDNNSNTWYDAAPTFSGTTESKGAQLEHQFQFEISNLYRQCEATIVQQDLMRKNPIVAPPLAFTEEEVEELGTKQADIRTYISKNRVAYYTGESNTLSQGKDAFLKELDLMGLGEMLEIMNDAYDRQYK